MESFSLADLHLRTWILQTIAMLITALFLPGLRVGPISALLAVIALAFVNTHFWDAALFFQLPNMLSMQVFTLLLVNGLIFWIVMKLLPGVDVDGCLPAIIAPVLFTLFSLGLAHIDERIDWSKLAQTTKQTAENIKDFVRSTPVPAATAVR